MDDLFGELECGQATDPGVPNIPGGMISPASSSDAHSPPVPMVIRRTDSRRRRVVIEEATSQLENGAPVTDEPTGTETGSNRKKKPARNYLPGAHRRHQPKSTDWIPKRPASVAIFMTALFLVVAAIVAATWLVPSTNETALTAGLQERLSVHGSISFSVWFSTVLLLVSGLASLQIHALRQHRSNDYRGTYRVWLLFSGLLILASINCVVDFGGLLQELTGFVRNRNSSWSTWVLPVAQILALGIIFIRGMVEVRKSPASLAVISLAWLAYVVSITLRIPGIETRLVQDNGFTAASLNLFATTGIFAAISIYSRHVYLRANGLVAVVAESAKPKRKPKPAKKPAASRPADLTGESKPATKKKARKTEPVTPVAKTIVEPAKRTVETPRNQPVPVTRDRFEKIEDSPEMPDFSDYISDDEPSIRRLSKTERKRLKKLQRSQQDRRAA